MSLNLRGVCSLCGDIVGHNRALIGIGGSLADPPLPHHRAYGSVPRRFDRVDLHSRGDPRGSVQSIVSEVPTWSFVRATPRGRRFGYNPLPYRTVVRRGTSALSAKIT